MKKVLLLLLAALLSACTMTTPEQNGDCLETGFEVVCHTQ